MDLPPNKWRENPPNEKTWGSASAPSRADKLYMPLLKMLLDPQPLAHCHLLICSECLRICRKKQWPSWLVIAMSLPPSSPAGRNKRTTQWEREALFPTKLSTKALLARLLQEWPTFLAPQSLVVPSVTCLSKQETWSKRVVQDVVRMASLRLGSWCKCDNPAELSATQFPPIARTSPPLKWSFYVILWVSTPMFNQFAHALLLLLTTTLLLLLALPTKCSPSTQVLRTIWDAETTLKENCHIGKWNTSKHNKPVLLLFLFLFLLLLLLLSFVAELLLLLLVVVVVVLLLLLLVVVDRVIERNFNSNPPGHHPWPPAGASSNARGEDFAPGLPFERPTFVGPPFPPPKKKNGHLKLRYPPGN